MHVAGPKPTGATAPRDGVHHRTQNGYTYSTYSPGGSNTGDTGGGGFILGSPASEPRVTFTASAINQTVPFQIRVVAEDVLSCWNGSGGVEAGQYPADSEEITYTEKTTSTGSTTPTVTFDSNNLLQ